MTSTVKTTCPYCGVGCGVLATTQADGAVDIKGDPDHPANFGRLCSKGSALAETLGTDDRLLYPEVNGKKSSWDNALDVVAQKFQATIAEHGPDSVAFYVSGQLLTEDYYVANKLMKGFIGSGNIDTNSRLCMASSVAGHKRAFGADMVPGVYDDLEEADLLILVGSNLAWCHPVLYQRVAAAKEARPNMRVVLIDPRRTMTAEIADLHLPISADGDTALFNGLLAYLNQNQKLDQKYIDQHTNGFSDVMKNVGNITIDDVANVTGLSSADIQTFYALYANTEKAVTVYSQGVNQSTGGTDKVNAIINCHLGTGRIGKPSMGPFSITGQPNAMGGREVGGLANMLAAHMEIENNDHWNLVNKFWNSPNLTKTQGLKAVDMFDAVADGRIKALWVMATNPVDSMPNAAKVEAAIAACPFVVVSDVISETDTLRHAHVKFPSAGWSEKDGTVTNSERRICRQRAFLPAAGDAKPDWWQLTKVAQRMGFDGFNYASPADIFREHAVLSDFENNGSRDFDIGSMMGTSDAAYNVMEPFHWPAPLGKPAGDPRQFSDGQFFTPDKRARFIAVQALSRQVTSKDYPLTLNTGRIRDQWHTMTRTGKSPKNSSHIGEPFCEIHPIDALKFGIGEATIVEVMSALTSIQVRALITRRVSEGTVFVPMHWSDQFASSARVDRLVSDRVDPVSGQPALKRTDVAIQSYEIRNYGFLVSKEKPRLVAADYWAVSKCEGGWRTELGFKTESLVQSFLVQFGKPSVELGGKHHSRRTHLFIENDELDAALFLAKQPVAVSRSWASDQLTLTHSDLKTRFMLGAGRPTNDQPDRGPIVCSCFSVGANEISEAVKSGCKTVAEIGVACRAGTNCGSCKSELNGFLHEDQLIAAE